ncbi:MAG: molybdopterin molybdenumtransferase MoeA, partial [Betaproteobacteria bacterium]|nr:molybdopterin molybdenumtransferase MoeA [Betaproteobacteria bacterium]
MSLDEALNALLEAAQPVPETEYLATLDCAGRVLAGALTSSIDVPPTDNSERDGWAIRLADWDQGLAVGPNFPISQRIPAGQTAQPL